MKNVIKVLLSMALLALASQAKAVPCGDPLSGVFLNDGSDATADCFDGTVSNDPFPNSITWGTDSFLALQKTDWMEGSGFDTSTVVDIDLTVSPDGAATDGSWSFTNLAAYDSYVIVLKDGGAVHGGVEAQWSAYLLDSSLFDAAAGSTWAGLWIYGSGSNDNLKAISHLSVYGRLGETVPEPGMVALLAIGLVGMVVVRRKTKI